jgi:hypothetical protein
LGKYGIGALAGRDFPGNAKVNLEIIAILEVLPAEAEAGTPYLGFLGRGKWHFYSFSWWKAVCIKIFIENLLTIIGPMCKYNVKTLHGQTIYN